MSRQPHLPTLIALACALFLRALVPTGWMPAASGGPFAIEPCVAAAPVPMAHPMIYHGADAAHHGSSHKTQHSGDCAFAPHHAGFASFNHVPVVRAAAVAAETSQQAAVTPSSATGLPAPPPPATGPPVLA